VWSLHKVYSNDEVKKWVVNGCTTAGIGCIECKRPVIDAVQAELKPMRQRALEYVNDKSAVLAILEKGAAGAREIARDTLEEVRKAMGLVGK
jgi:tryptophanyl-tRNA synthetase